MSIILMINFILKVIVMHVELTVRICMVQIMNPEVTLNEINKTLYGTNMIQSKITYKTFLLILVKNDVQNTIKHTKTNTKHFSLLYMGL